ncbi:MAG: (2Fe-2S) ferredoxin domain-containing protein [Spirochaetes bacterium]|nr:(2Fe-2S) ferredoxin domain-containing protein [Spirochaetota bacterium]
MAKLTLEELRKLRDNKKHEIQKRETDNKEIDVIVGMGTCGIAAGAKDALDAFIAEIDKHNLTNVRIKQTGCMGFCTYEPTVEVKVPDMPDTIYNNVSVDVAKLIVGNHLVRKQLVSEHVFDRPSVDIIENK